MIRAQLFVQRGRGLFEKFFSFLLPGGELRFAETGACFGQFPTFGPHYLLTKAHGFFEDWQCFGGALLSDEQVAMRDQRLRE